MDVRAPERLDPARSAESSTLSQLSCCCAACMALAALLPAAGQHIVCTGAVCLRGAPGIPANALQPCCICRQIKACEQVWCRTQALMLQIPCCWAA